MRLRGAACLAVFAALSLPTSADDSFERWVALEKRVSAERMLRNISPQGARPGTILASPSGNNPDYRFHWPRDASLVMDQVIALGGAELPARVSDYVSLTRHHQLQPSAEGLGEPRYRVDGSADTLPWARPQYDGPALRALTLIRALPFVQGNTRAETLAAIRVDLDFVARYWRKPCFDLWEEMRGLHFYTQAVQQAALHAGADLLETEGDLASSGRFRREAEQVASALEFYWDERREYIGATRELEIRPHEPEYKDENLDTSVILAALHARVNTGILAWTDDRLLATAHALESAFAREYGINSGSGAVAIGRFTDDVYFGGNPWYLTTAAFAELSHLAAAEISSRGGITLTSRNSGFLGSNLAPGTRILASSPEGKALLARLRTKGDAFLAIVRKHAGSQGEMSEQFDRDAGVPVSAHDLTWSYAGFLSAARAREMTTGN